MRRREFLPALAAAAVAAARGRSGRSGHAGRRLSQRPLARRDGEPPCRLPPRPRGGGRPRWRAACESNTAGRTAHYERLPALAAELVERRVALIATAGGKSRRSRPKRRRRACRSSSSRRHPIGTGLVASLSRPGGNVTGVSLFIDFARPKEARVPARACSTAIRSTSGIRHRPPEPPTCGRAAVRSGVRVAARSGRGRRDDLAPPSRRWPRAE